MSGHADSAGGAVEDFGLGETGGAELLAEGVGGGFARDGNDLRLLAQGLLEDGFDVVTGG